MSLASWLRLSKSRTGSALKSKPQPSRPRLQVEQLEDRMLLAAGVDQAAFLNNPSATFNTQQIGQTPPVSPTFLPGNSALATTQIVNGMQFLNGVAIGAQANLLTQSQVNNQFRAFGVNSQGSSGDGNTPNGLAWIYLQTAMGFGSGVMPNAPWMPAAYNLGLANHQFNYASQSDMGFQPTPPWTHRFTYPIEEQTQPLETELPDWVPQSWLKQLFANDEEQDNPDGVEQKLDSSGQETPALPKQTDTDEAAPEWTRGDPAVEEALFTEPLDILAARYEANWWNPLAARPARMTHTLRGSEAQADGFASEEDTIARPLSISALGPSEMAALVSGLPGAAMLVDGSGDAAASGDAG